MSKALKRRIRELEDNLAEEMEKTILYHVAIVCLASAVAKANTSIEVSRHLKLMLEGFAGSQDYQAVTEAMDKLYIATKRKESSNG